MSTCDAATIVAWTKDGQPIQPPSGTLPLELGAVYRAEFSGLPPVLGDYSQYASGAQFVIACISMDRLTTHVLRTEVYNIGDPLQIFTTDSHFEPSNWVDESPQWFSASIYGRPSWLGPDTTPWEGAQGVIAFSLLAGSLTMTDLTVSRIENPTLYSAQLVPEPSTYAMALAGLACGGYSMWRRRKRA